MLLLSCLVDKKQKKNQKQTSQQSGTHAGVEIKIEVGDIRSLCLINSTHEFAQTFVYKCNRCWVEVCFQDQTEEQI